MVLEAIKVASRTIILFEFHGEKTLGQIEESKFSFLWKENKTSKLQ